MEITSHTNTRRKDRMSYEQVFSINGGNRPPQAPDLEENVLGALMLDPNALPLNCYTRSISISRSIK